MDYKVGDRYKCPWGRKAEYTINKIGKKDNVGLLRFDVKVEGHEVESWQCGEWHMDECVRIGDMILVGRAIVLDEELFTL